MKKNEHHIRKTIGKSLLWKLLERFGVSGISFILQIILARLLSPEHYGVLSLMIIFTTLANVFVQTGFSTALIRDKEVTEEDYSSVFWISLGIAVIAYGIIYFASPYIALFYGMPDIVRPFRILALMLLPGAFNSIQLAKISREMDFKKIFYSNVGAIIASGIIGILMALMGGGIWALVLQSLSNACVTCIIMLFTVRWYPKFICNLSRIRILFSFGWKLLVSNLLDTLYQDLRSLVIGKKYNSNTLGYYNRGKQFPQFIINAINGAVQSVMLPAMAKEQDEQEKVKLLTRNSIMICSYIIFPIMAGLAGVATPLVRLLLTDKWLPCVPFMQIYCFTLAFYPVHSCNLQAINAMGRSDIFLKLEIVKKSYGLVALIIAVFCFDSPIAIAMTGIFTAFISCFVNASPNKKLIGYSYKEQMKDIIPTLFISTIMLLGVLGIQFLNLSTILTLVVQVIVGMLIYVFLSVICKIEAFSILMNMVKQSRKN